MSIDKFLSTKQGAKALKAKLKAMPEHEKKKPSYAPLWKKTCEAVNEFNIEKMKKQLRDGVTSPAPAKKEPQLEPKSKASVAESTATAPSSETGTTAKEPKKKSNSNYTKAEILDHIKQLEEKYPSLFNLDNPKPLKVEINQDIKDALGWEDNLIKAVLFYYV